MEPVARKLSRAVGAAVRGGVFRQISEQMLICGAHAERLCAGLHGDGVIFISGSRSATSSI